MSRPPRATADAFDRAASSYPRDWGEDPVARLHRARVHRWLEQLLPPRARVLDLGCGPGLDAIALGRRGHTIVGVDASPRMVQEARARGVDARVTDLRSPTELPDGPFDAVLSNFGALNCVPLEPLGPALHARLRPGAPLLAVVMSRFCPAEVAALLLTGHPREAVQRRRRPYAPVAGADVAVRWLSPRDVARALSPWFEPIGARALGVAMPPPGRTGAAFHRLARPLNRLDDALGRLPLLRRWGDHVAVCLTAADAP